jgi:hypothetical protein
VLTRAEAVARLRVLAQGIDEPSENAAVERFLERVAGLRPRSATRCCC